MLQGDRQQVCSQWSRRRPRWGPQPADPGGTSRSPCSRRSPLPAPTPSPGGCGPMTQTRWPLPLSRVLRPGRRPRSSLGLGELPSGCPLLSVLWPGASEVIVARGGQGQTSTHAGVCRSEPRVALHAAGAELGCRAGSPGMASAGKGLRSAPGLSVTSQFSPASIPTPPGEGLSGHSSSCPGLGWPMGARGGRRGWAGSREEAGPGAAAHGCRGCGRRGCRREELGGRPAAGRGCPRPAFRPSALPRPAPPASWAHLEMFDLIECRFTLQK